MLIRNKIKVKFRYIFLIFFVLMIMIFWLNHLLVSRYYRSIPLSFSGELSRQAVEQNHSWLVTSVEELKQTSEYIIRGRIIKEQLGSIVTGVRLNGVRPRYSNTDRHAFYQIEVLDIYKGDMQIGDIVEIHQFKYFRSRTRTRAYRNLVSGDRNTFDGSSGERVLRRVVLQLSEGDDLILFLDSAIFLTGLENGGPGIMYVRLPNGVTGVNINPFNPIQGLYYYTPQYQRQGYDNFIFQSVNPHNNLTLTEEDLRRISQRSE